MQQTYRSLCHPNLLRLVAVTTTPTGVALLTNFVEGKNLHSIIFGHTEKVAVLQVMLACIYIKLLHSDINSILQL